MKYLISFAHIRRSLWDNFYKKGDNNIGETFFPSIFNIEDEIDIYEEIFITKKNDINEMYIVQFFALDFAIHIK